MEGMLSEIRMFAGNFAPVGWEFCKGQIISIEQNIALFSLIHTLYGGDGKENFALPDFRGRIPVGSGYAVEGDQDYYRQGKIFGAETVLLKEKHLPPYEHGRFQDMVIAAFDNHGAASIIPYDNCFAAVFDPRNILLGYPKLSVEVALSGMESNSPIAVMQPYLAVHFIICMQGAYPERDLSF